MSSDMKAGLTNSKPKLSLLGQNAVVHLVRAKEYGCDAYARGNYHREPPAGIDTVDRFLGYIDAAMRHLTSVAQAINVARGRGEDQAAACAVVDDIPSSTGFPPSMLPHIAHAMASLSIGIEVGVQDGLLPSDPGQPWKCPGTDGLECAGRVPATCKVNPVSSRVCKLGTRSCVVEHEDPIKVAAPTESEELRAQRDAQWVIEYARALGASPSDVREEPK